MATINGTSGNDTLSGTAGDDTINGLGGGDLFLAGSTGGNDVIDGGTGFDTIEFRERATSAIVVDFVAGTISGGSSGTISFTNVERVIGGNFGDTLTGNAASQTLTGRFGADTLWGAGGVDTLWGGGDGNTFVFRETGTANADHINDFASGSDKILLDASVMSALGASGNFAAGDDRFVANSSGTAADAEDRIVFNTTTKQVFYDADGSASGAAVLIATLQSSATLVATDIVVEGDDTPPSGGETINGTSGNDSLVGGSGDDTINGFAGRDTISGLEGNDVLTGGEGADIFVFAAAPGTANADSILDYTSRHEDIVADTIWLDATVMPALGTAGRFSQQDERFAVNSTGTAQDASDRIIFNFNNGQLWYDADGNGAGAAQLIATLSGHPATEEFVVINGSPSGQVINGTSGNDSLIGTAGDDTIHGLDGNDTLDGLDGGDVLDGGAGNDSLLGREEADDLLIGGDGNDTLQTAFNDSRHDFDTLDGGMGDDMFIIDVDWSFATPEHVSNLTLLDAGGVDTIKALSGNWVLGAGFENLILGFDIPDNGSTHGTGNELDNVITGVQVSWVNNNIDGADGDDTMIGGAGDDAFKFAAGSGNIGSDDVDGGGGVDALDYSGARSAVVIDLRTGTASGGGNNGTGSLAFVNIENAVGSAFNDLLIAHDNGWQSGERWPAGLEGGGGNDTLLGGLGDDRLRGDRAFDLTDSGDDELRGGDGADTLFGGPGADRVEGGAGIDEVIGGDGADTFAFTVAPGTSNADLISDFRSADDQIVLDGTVHANSGPSGRFATGDARFWSSTSGMAHDADDRVIYDTDSGELWYDADGIGSDAPQLIGTLHARFDPTPASLAATDIAIVNGSTTPPPPPGGQVINGTSGNDTLTGTAGNDTINGLGGNDLFVAGSTGGNDVIDGGAGHDTIEFRERATSAVVVDFGTGSISGGSSGTISFTNVERIVGGDFNDSMSGNAASQTLTGKGGNDTLWGAGGVDTLWGLTGADTFVFRETGTAHADRISDWTSGVDTVALDNATMSALGSDGDFVAGDTRFASGAGFTAGRDTSDRVVFDTSTGRLYYDADGSGSGAAQLIATVQSGASVAASDIVVI